MPQLPSKRFARLTVRIALICAPLSVPSWAAASETLAPAGGFVLPTDVCLLAPADSQSPCFDYAIAEVSRLLGWLEAHAPTGLWGMATLQALCGLRMLEASDLRRQDVNLKAGTITIAETARHRRTRRPGLSLNHN